MRILKVSASSAPNSVAGAISNVIKEDNETEVQAVGAGAINQAVKAIAIARGYLTPSGIDLCCQPAFITLEIDGQERTGIRFLCKLFK
jgi:stage V sporulation protein S